MMRAEVVKEIETVLITPSRKAQSSEDSKCTDASGSVNVEQLSLQPKYGFKGSLDELTVKVDNKAQLWANSKHSSLRSEMSAEKKRATDLLLHIIGWLESKGLKIGARDLVSSEAELRELLCPRRPSTTLRNCRMFQRFIEFYEGSVFDVGSIDLSPKVINSWLRQLLESNVGKFTPRLAMGCLSHLSEYLDFEYVGNHSLLYRKVRDFEEGKVLPVENAAPFDSKFIMALEEIMYDNVSFSVPDRLVAARIRALIQSSTRHHDQKNTPVGSLRRLLNEDKSDRGIIAQADRTKTFARSWSCSRLALNPKFDGWTDKFYDLLVQAHGEDFHNEDHLGKRASSDRNYFDVGPPDSQADCSHMKIVLVKYNKLCVARDGASCFSDEEILSFRHHRAKCTLPTLAQHKGLDLKAVRMQGGWRGKAEDLMPDAYLRAKQVLAIKLQETCLMYLRGGGSIPKVVTQEMSAPVADPSSVEVPSSEIPSQLDDSEESEEDPLRNSDSDAESESEEESLPTFLGIIVVNPKTGCYHSPCSKGLGEPLCGVPCKGLISLPADAFDNWRRSRPSKCCNRCFARVSSNSFTACTHICGHFTPAGVCTLRCAEIHTSSDEGHDCFQCSNMNASERKAKRAKCLDKGIAEMNSELADTLEMVNVED